VENNVERIEKRLQAGEILIIDGAMGTALQELGLQVGECPEMWCLTHPEKVKSIHKSYREAGSDIVECNSFGGTRYKLRNFGLEDRVVEINRAAAAIAYEAADGTQHVLGSIGPTGEFMEPYGIETEEAFFEAFAEQAKALEEGGADAVVIETMMAIEECCVAVKAARACTDLTVIASFTFNPKQGGGYVSMMGVTPAQFALAATEAGAHVIGANCGLGSEHMIEVVREIRKAVKAVHIMAMPNAGMPKLVNGETIFDESPDLMAENCKILRDAGATLIGGCCGTTPEHIAAISKILKSQST
jgi:5-methyltetrahydrofolate--homocysteine methyltransferase